MTGYRGWIGYGIFNALERKCRCFMAPQCFAICIGAQAIRISLSIKQQRKKCLALNCLIIVIYLSAISVRSVCSNNNHENKIQNMFSIRSSWMVPHFLFLKYNLRWNVTSCHTCIAHNYINLWCALRCGIFKHLKWKRTCISSRKICWRKNCSHNCIIGYKSWEKKFK